MLLHHSLCLNEINAAMGSVQRDNSPTEQQARLCLELQNCDHANG